MPIDMHHNDEAGRIAALRRLCVLDSCSEERFDRITLLVRAVLDVPIAAVSLVDVDRQWFKSVQGLDRLDTPRSISFCDHTIRSDAAMAIKDTHRDARFSDNPLVASEPHIRAYLGAPLRTGDGYNVGALCAIDTRPRDFTAEQMTLLTTFAGLVVDELELRQLADRDHLTGALTRRAFLNRLERLRRPEDRRSVLALFDLDHFKRINDRYGHPAGDEVLQRVAGACREQLRRGDALGRLGGEEFGLLLTDAGIEEAHDRIEIIRMTIAELQFRMACDLRVTASFGMVELDGKSSANAIAVADAALYTAKKTGRNRTMSAAGLLEAA